ncbi:molybdopterin molybdotransferase MoeA [Pedobacter hiemivivus]|uniref:Molybdopterin molybdenumtransferase n=1 Tax=Pedobacter hiemivivus TaxID=2530454 RepID=A0A4R0MFA6_9SPHI|nr:molybdopterin molybdotransferase MoeA [Pedobacter hiemivivus]TCC84612.1 molybdopterin molybdenumtransferase MoeA [Pedobacter hiemivivus]
MKTFEEAIAIISSISNPFDVETINLEAANGRILAENIHADRDYPPFNRAAMDGYAIMQSDWEKGIRKYSVIDTIFTGQPAKHALISGACYKIMTGAATPELANLIIRREDAEEFEDKVVLHADTIKTYQNIARQGEDTLTGTLLLSAPTRCTPQIISLLATVGKARLQVYKSPRVAIVTTGDEVIDPASQLSPFQIRNSNQYLLRSLLEQWKILPVLCEHVSDDRDKLTATLTNALAADLVIINGAVSAGDADHVPAVLKELGVKTLFHKVSIRPGKPLLVGKTTAGTVVFALPGNPLSCLTTFTIFVEHYLFRCFGFEGRPFQTIPLLENRTKKHPLTEFFPVSTGHSGGLGLLSYNGSGDVTAAINANGLAMQPAASAQLHENDAINFYPFNNYFK